MINTHDQLTEAVRGGLIPKKQAVAVSYSPRPEGRMGMAQCNQTRVWSPFFETRPEAPWYDYGCKTFIGKRSVSLPKALQWASEQYGITEWTGNAMRDKVPAIVQYKLPLKRVSK